VPTMKKYVDILARVSGRPGATRGVPVR